MGTFPTLLRQDGVEVGELFSFDSGQQPEAVVEGPEKASLSDFFRVSELIGMGKLRDEQPGVGMGEGVESTCNFSGGSRIEIIEEILADDGIESLIDGKGVAEVGLKPGDALGGEPLGFDSLAGLVEHALAQIDGNNFRFASAFEQSGKKAAVAVTKQQNRLAMNEVVNERETRCLKGPAQSEIFQGGINGGEPIPPAIGGI